MNTIDTLDNRPFRHLITTIGALPTSFIDSMSYYEMLAWLCDYLEKTVIPAVNENAEVLEELQDAFVTLKDYVDNYFDNLDIQTEVDNKLDEMAEGGQLADIIAAYLQLKGVLAFNTPADIEDATNLVDGSFVQTYGYKVKGDGVTDQYIVRTILNTDVIDGYNLVGIDAAPTLVAERLPKGKEVVVKMPNFNDVDIQDYLDLTCKKTIILPKATTVTLTSPLFINSDTTLDLNGTVVTFDLETTIGLFTYKLDDTFTGYDGNANITIKNGGIVDGCFSMLHNKNLTIENVEFTTSNCDHSIQFAGCYGVTVKNCIFNGTRGSVDYGSECINIDPCIYGGQPYAPESSPMFDRTPNKNIVIDGNKFNTPASETLIYSNGVGTHGTDENYPIVTGLVIQNNEFGQPAYSAISLANANDVTIENNTCTGNVTTYGIVKRGFINNINIVDNQFDIKNGFYRDASGANPVLNLNISNNRISADDANTDSNAVIRLNDVQGGSVEGNTIKFKNHAVYCLDKSSGGDGGSPNSDYYSKNIVISNNVFIKTTVQDSYFDCRVRYSDDITFVGNKFLHPAGGLESNFRELMVQDGTTNLYVKNNFTDQPKHFIDKDHMSYLTTNFFENNAQYQLLALQSGKTSDSGTLPANCTVFSKIRLLVGDGTSTQILEVKPWIGSKTKLDAGRAWKFPVCSSTNTFAYANFSIDANGVDWTYTGTLGLRFMDAAD